ncbi:replication initiation factor domain-containing protein [Variovorax terrae]|uniref:Replication initiation factor domain-containing protein n=1 Tax=Variovorax terrae TaxID=2923278 RepID=A0A9X1VWZ6_9BURK|nr:replication initiation factor domain-containing protein [Variovorax terrae]MCJ0765326.1 replication initiation factor domain-containing protein [Variovorax terrae]
MTAPLSNTGVNNVRGLTRDERLVLEGGKVKVLCAERQQDGASGVIVDYLRVTVRRDAVLSLARLSDSDDEALTRYLAFGLAGVLGFTLGESRNGRDFYDYTWTVNNEFDKEVASVSGGGVTQRETFCLTLKGEACTFAAKGWEKSLHAWLSSLDPRVTRIDLARDYLGGELTIEEVEGCYRTGAFDYRNRRPSYTRHGSGDGHDRAREHSRTFQVGQRESGKLMRAYEKGHAFKMLSDPWVRVEVELRNVNRIVPFDALIRPADFFAGAYDFCQWVLDKKPEAERIPTGKAVGERTVSRFTRWLENVVAPSIRAVQACADSAEWADLLTIKHMDRRIPRGLSGLSHAKVRDGLREWIHNLSAAAPAGYAPSM